MTGFVDLPVGKAGAEAVGIVKAVEVDLRLGVMMGRIAGPLAGVAEHLTQDHVGEGGVVIVEEGLDLPLHGAHQLAVGAGVLGLHGFGGVEDGLVVPFVDGLLDVDLAVAAGGETDLGAPGRQQAVGLVMEAVGTPGLNGLVVPGDLHSALEKQHRAFLLFLADGEGVPFFHEQQAYVHHGTIVVLSGVDIGIVAPLQLGVLIQVSHACLTVRYARGYSAAP